jgi:hypothetical protein
MVEAVAEVATLVHQQALPRLAQEDQAVVAQEEAELLTQELQALQTQAVVVVHPATLRPRHMFLELAVRE